MIVKGINILQKEKKNFWFVYSAAERVCAEATENFNQPTTTTTIIRSHCALRQPPDHLPTCCCSAALSLSLTS